MVHADHEVPHARFGTLYVSFVHSHNRVDVIVTKAMKNTVYPHTTSAAQVRGSYRISAFSDSRRVLRSDSNVSLILISLGPYCLALVRFVLASSTFP